MTKKVSFSLQHSHIGGWPAVISDGSQEAYINGSSVPVEPLLPLLWAVRSLLTGNDESSCTWWGEPGQHRWLFVRREKQLQIHIKRFNDSFSWLNEKGETVIQLECDLLAFAKRLPHQLGQLTYQEGKPAIEEGEYQKLKEAIRSFEHSIVKNK